MNYPTKQHKALHIYQQIDHEGFQQGHALLHELGLPKDYIQDKEQNNLFKNLYDAMQDCFNDKTEKLLPGFLQNLMGILHVIRDGEHVEIINKEKDQLEKFVLSGLDFLDQNVAIIAAFDHGLRDENYKNRYQENYRGRQDFHSDIICTLSCVNETDAVNEKARDYILGNIDHWYDDHDKEHNENMIMTALEMQETFPDKTYPSDRFLIKTLKNTCQIEKFGDNHNDVTAWTYKWNKKHNTFQTTRKFKYGRN